MEKIIEGMGKIKFGKFYNNKNKIIKSLEDTPIIDSQKVKNISLFLENGFSWMAVCIQEFAVSHNVKVVLLCFYRLKKQNFLLTERFLCGKTIL
mgnify:CR=1 FL=1